MTNPAASPRASHKRYFFDKFGITERLLERCLGEALSAGGDYADLYFESVTPKLFCRVRRFQQVLRLIGSGRPVAWAAVAADCGYFDQAHFIHDFRAFSGINPSTYIAQRTEHLNHVPMPE